MTRMSRRALRLVCWGSVAVSCAAVCGFGATRSARAAEAGYGIGYSFERDSNLTLSSSDPRPDSVNSPLLGLGYRQSGSDLSTNIVAFGQYNNYWDNVYPNGPLYYADATGLLGFFHRSLTWAADDQYRELQPTLTVPGTPGNVVGVNAFSTGPSLSLREGIDTFVLGARYGNYVAQGQPTDNQSYGGYVDWLHDLSTTTRLSFGYFGSTVHFRDEVNNVDYGLQMVTAGIERRDPSSRLRLEAGSTRYNPVLGAARNRPVLEAEWRYLPTSNSKTGLNYQAEYSTPGAQIMAQAAAPSFGTVPTPTVPMTYVANGSTFYLKQIDGYYAVRVGELGGGVSAFHSDSDYESVPSLSTQQEGGHVEGSYFGGTTFSVTAYADYVRNRFPALVPLRTDRDRTGGMRVQYYLSPRVSAAIEVSRTVQTSTAPGESYADNRILFTIFYASVPWLSVP